MLSQRSLKIPSLFRIHFLLCCFVWVISIALSSSLLIHACVSSVLLTNPSRVFFSSVITFVCCFPVYFFVEVVSVVIRSSPEIGEHLYDHCFDLFIKYMAYLYIGLFVGICLVLWFGTYSSVSSVLGRMVSSLSRKGIVLMGAVPCGLEAQFDLATRAMVWTVLCPLA